jgi:cell division transport system ATP-binding protein
MSSAQGQPHILFEDVAVRYSELVYGLRGISFSVARGEFVFLCGQTGSGKSTILKTVTRQIDHTSGRVLLNGKDLAAVPRKDVPHLRREMGVVPQDFGLLQNKKVWENVGYAMRAVGRTRREVVQQVSEILDRVNILHRADAYPNELSGGEQQRVAIARALINNPPLLLADELTGNLDLDHKIEIMQLLAQLNLRGTTILVATHDLQMVERLNKRVLRLDHGEIEADLVVGDV